MYPQPISGTVAPDMDDTLRCFLAVPARLDVSPIAGLLKERDVEFERGLEASSFFGSHPTNIRRLIQNADFVLAVIDAEDNSSHVLVELGIALGIRRPVFAILTPNSTIPFSLQGVPTVRAQPDDTSAIDFHLDIFLKEGLRRKSIQRRLAPPDKPWMRSSNERLSNEFLAFLSSSSSAEHQLEKSIAHFLETKGFHIEQSTPSKGFRPDIAVWLQEPSSALGSQLLIEIKRGERRDPGESRIANQLREYLSAVDARAGLLLWQVASDGEAPKIYPGYPFVFSLSLPAFVKLVDKDQLLSALIRERNRQVHGIQ
jgi:hypothetical protein